MVNLPDPSQLPSNELMFITVDDPTCLLVPSGFDGACSKGKKVFVISKHPATLMLKISTNSALQLEIFLIKNLRWSGLTNLIYRVNLCEMHFQFTNHIAGCCLCSLRTLLSSKALCGFRQVAITWNSLFRYSFTNPRPTPLEHPVTKTVFEQTLIFYDSKRL